MRLRGLVLGLAIGLAVAGCGGSGSGPSTPQLTGNVSQQSATSTSQNMASMLDLAGTVSDFETLQSTPPVSNTVAKHGARAVISNGCPVVTDNRPTRTSPIPDPWIVTFDYGSGCTDPHINRVVTGTIRTTFSGFSANPQNPTGTATAQFTNVNFNAQTYNGTVSLTFTSRTSANLSLDITAQSSSATRHLVLSGTLTTSGSGAGKTLRFSGTGSYSDSDFGSFTLTFDNLLFTKTCQFPTAGTLTINGFGSNRAVVTFGAACGNACARINNGPSACFNL